MDANEFRQLLELFPVVRSRDYNADLESNHRSAPNKQVKEWQEAWDTNNEDNKSRGEAESSRTNNNPGFWDHLRFTAERKMGMDAADAERFCDAFQRVYKKFVYEELTLEAAVRIVTGLKKS